MVTEEKTDKGRPYLIPTEHDDASTDRETIYQYQTKITPKPGKLAYEIAHIFLPLSPMKSSLGYIAMDIMVQYLMGVDKGSM